MLNIIGKKREDALFFRFCRLCICIHVLSETAEQWRDAAGPGGARGDAKALWHIRLEVSQILNTPPTSWLYERITSHESISMK